MIKKLSRSIPFCVVTSSFVACTTTTLNDSNLPPYKHATPLKISSTKPPSLSHAWLNTPPADYIVWLNQGDHRQRVEHYQQYLKDNQVEDVIPMYQLLRSARDWQQCNGTPYAVPTPELWHNAIGTIKVLKLLVDSGALSEFEVTSVFRNYSLNICAGGAPRSKHVYNAAIDFRIGPEGIPSTQDLLMIDESKRRICHFWSNYGQSLNLGLGVYASGQIHLDTQGYRTWGPDLTRHSSMCQY